MATLKKRTITVDNAAGERLTLDFIASVNDHGTFKLRLPDTLASDSQFIDALQRALRKDHVGRLDVERVHKYAAGRDMQKLHEAMVAAMKDYVAVETTRELVIVYATDLRVSFWENADGTMAPNGYHGADGRWGGGKGLGDLHATNCVNSYRVGLYARVWTRVTHLRGEAVTTLYEPIHPGLNDRDPISRLNGFAGLLLEADDVATGHMRGSDARVEIMPYTPEAAEFFARMLLGMCGLARRMRTFFQDKDRLQLAISSGTAPLLSAPAPKEIA